MNRKTDIITEFCEISAEISGAAIVLRSLGRTDDTNQAINNVASKQRDYARQLLNTADRLMEATAETQGE